MPLAPELPLYDLPSLRDCARVFRDREHAGEVLADMLAGYRGSEALVLGIPAGGVPVAARIATALGLGLDVAVVSKILLPWTTEAGYGAVAYDGSVWIDRRAVARFGLSESEVRDGTEKARAKVLRRVALLRGGRLLEPGGRTVILVDDGVAAGSTLRAAIAALRTAAVARLVVAVPTGHGRSVRDLAAEVDEFHCANLRHGLSFAVADAYQAWHDVGEDEVVTALGVARARANGTVAPVDE